MALQEPFMVKNDLGNTAGQTVELEADTGKALLIKDVMIGGADAPYVEFLIDKVTVGYYRVNRGLGSHLPFPFGWTKHSHDTEEGTTALASSANGKELVDAEGNDTNIAFLVDSGNTADVNRLLQYFKAQNPRKTILKLMGELGWFNGYPVPEGSKFVVKPSATSKKLGDVSIVYEIYDPADISADMPNGAEADEYVYINYGDTGAAITSAGDNLIDTSNIPTQFPQFPIGVDVPAKTEIDLLGIVGTEVMDWDASDDYTYTKYLKLLRGRKALFDEDRNGLLFYQPEPSNPVVGIIAGEGYSVIGGFSDYDMRLPFIMPVPMTFGSGEELNVYITTDAGTNEGSIDAEYQEIGFIQKVRRVA